MTKYKTERPCKRGHYERYEKSRHCVECCREANIARISEDPVANRRAVAAWAAKNPVKLTLRKAKWRAKRDGVPFNLVASDVVIPEFCPVLGLKLERGWLSANDGSPTLDKRVPSDGYVRGNVTVISNKANRIKNDATVEELQAVVDWLRKFPTGTTAGN
jgi:hypothetical protein